MALPKQDLVIAESLGLILSFSCSHTNQTLAKILNWSFKYFNDKREVKYAQVPEIECQQILKKDLELLSPSMNLFKGKKL